MGNSISAFIQVYKHQRAVFEALKSFRTHYKNEPITVVSDNGDDFTKICKALDADYIHSPIRAVIGPGEAVTLNQTSLDGFYEMMRRFYNHCLSTETDWVVIMEPDVRTIRRIRSFPTTALAGARQNPYSDELTTELVRRFGEKPYVYGTAGGGLVNRQAFIRAYEGNLDLSGYAQYDEKIELYADAAMGLLFHINNLDYSVWDEVSEILHPFPIIRDSAFDHGYKYWYDKEFSDDLLSGEEL